MTLKKIFQLFCNHNIIDSKNLFYSPSPEYPAACRRDDQPSLKATARHDGEVNYGAIPLDTPPLAAGSFIA
jgi:hypothetical protein